MTKSSVKPAIWFWIVAAIGLIWNAMGVNAYLQQAFKTEGYKEMYSPEQIEIAANMPTWVTAAFAIAVFSGFIGCVALLLRKRIANGLLLLSLIAVIAQMGYLIITEQAADMIMTVMIIVFAILLVLFARKFKSKHWIS